MGNMIIQFLVLHLMVGFSIQTSICAGIPVGDIVGYNEADCLIEYCGSGNTLETRYPFGELEKHCCLDTKIVDMEVLKNLEKDGAIIELGCEIKTCQNGNWVPSPNTNCCKDKSGQMKKPDARKGDGCVEETCTAGKWVPSPNTQLNTCKKCYAWGDPHFEVFSEVKFNWYFACNYALVQEGTTKNPKFGVFMDFREVGTVAYVGGPTTYQEDPSTEVVLNPGNTPTTLFTVKVSGNSQPISQTTPTLLQGPGSIQTTVYAWKHSSCVRLYGKPQILVELCESTITIWAPPQDKNQYLYNLGGFCGSTDSMALQNKKLVARDGLEYSNPAGLPEFALSWKAEKQTKPECQTPKKGKRSTRKLRSVDTTDEQIRMACNNDNNSNHKMECENAVHDIGGNELKTCMFDLCIFDDDKAQVEAGFTKDMMLAQHKEIDTVTKSHKISTIKFVPDEAVGPVGCGNGKRTSPNTCTCSPGYTGDACDTYNCPDDWSLFSAGICYQARDNDGTSIFDIGDDCYTGWGTYAAPENVTAINDFISKTYPTGTYWILSGWYTGKRAVGGGNFPRDHFEYIYRDNYTTAITNICLDINGRHECIIPQVYICEREFVPDESCPSPWFRVEEECFLQVTELRTWTQAQGYCEQQASGADLAAPDNLKALDDYLLNLDNGIATGTGYWLGGSHTGVTHWKGEELDVYEQWEWVSWGNIYGGWQNGRPNDADSANCVQMLPGLGDNSLDNLLCDSPRPFICEREFY